MGRYCVAKCAPECGIRAQTVPIDIVFARSVPTFLVAFTEVNKVEEAGGGEVEVQNVPKKEVVSNDT